MPSPVATAWWHGIRSLAARAATTGFASLEMMQASILAFFNMSKARPSLRETRTDSIPF